VDRVPDRALPLFAVSLAASLGLFLAAALPFGGALSLFTPLPVAYCYWKSRLPGLAVALAGVLFVSLPTGPESRLVALLFLELATAGVILGELLRRPLGPEATVALGVLGIGLMSAAVFLVRAATSGQSPAGLAAGYVSRIVAEAKGNLTALGYGPKEELDITLAGLVRLLPAVLTLSVGATFGLNVAVARRLLAALKAELAAWPAFQVWRAPEPLVWALIAAGLAIIADLGPSHTVGLNVLVVVAVVYFMQGLAISAFYLEKMRVPRVLRIIIYAALGLEQYLSLAVAAAGLFDLWLDFRRLNQAAVEEA